jgi:hypothetical protein
MRCLALGSIAAALIASPVFGCGQSESDASSNAGGAGQSTSGGSNAAAGTAAGKAGASSAGTATSGGSSGVHAAGGADGIASGGVPAGDAGAFASGGADSGGAGGGALVDCDQKKILCKRLAPQCAEGEVPSVAGSCYGDCVKIDRCACSDASACPEPDKYTCWSKTHCGPFVQ